MKITFGIPAPVGVNSQKIFQAIRKELELIQAQTNLGLGALSTPDDGIKMATSFTANNFSPQINGSVEILGKEIQFELNVPDCHPFKGVIGQTFIGSFHDIKVPITNATV